MSFLETCRLVRSSGELKDAFPACFDQPLLNIELSEAKVYKPLVKI